eukprot:gene3267-2409_t
MGCISSRRVVVILSARRSMTQSIEERHAAPQPNEKSTSIQDDARSFRSKVGALKMLIRTPTAYDSILKYLKQNGRGEYLVCYRDMEEIKGLDDDQMVSRTAALIWRYKTSFEAVRSRGHVTDTIEYRIWECFGKLRQLDIANAHADVVKKYLIIAQNEIMARLVIPFDDYLGSATYKEWQDSQIDAEKQRRQIMLASRQNSRDNSQNFSLSMTAGEQSGRVSTMHSSRFREAASPANSFHSTAGGANLLSAASNVASSGSAKQQAPFLGADFAVCAADYPEVLVVDDSLVTLKITGLTLERDGHKVERASNGQIALQLMKSHPNSIREEDEYDDDVSDISDSDDELYGEEASLPRPLPAEPTTQVSQPVLLSFPNSPSSDHRKAQTTQATDDAAGHSVVPMPGERQMRRTLTNEHYHQLIVGMSGNIDDETRERAFRAGMDFFLPKPFTLQKFIETLRQSRELKRQQWLQAKGGASAVDSSSAVTDLNTIVDSMAGSSTSTTQHTESAKTHPQTATTSAATALAAAVVAAACAAVDGNSAPKAAPNALVAEQPPLVEAPPDSTSAKEKAKDAAVSPQSLVAPETVPTPQ